MYFIPIKRILQLEFYGSLFVFSFGMRFKCNVGKNVISSFELVLFWKYRPHAIQITLILFLIFPPFYWAIVEKFPI